jgi:hypothetical protein
MHKKILTGVRAVVVLTAGTLLTMAPIARAELTAEQQCNKGRYDAAAKYNQCHGKAIARFFATSDVPTLQSALSKCRAKYTAAWVKIARAAVGTGSTCDTPRFVDNGNGTVTDNLTGLDWELKTDDATVHDKDNMYNWSSAYSCFLSGHSSCAGLNKEISFSCFGGSPCSWRLPTLAELQTILSEPFPCTTSPCIAPVFGPTLASYYWTSTTLGDNSNYAWYVRFDDGTVFYDQKISSNHVRAVRGGL